MTEWGEILVVVASSLGEGPRFKGYSVLDNPFSGEKYKRRHDRHDRVGQQAYH